MELVIDARGDGALEKVRADLATMTQVIAVSGDVTQEQHRVELVRAVAGYGGLDLLVNNAGALGPSPLPALLDYPLRELEQIYQTNAVAPLALVQALRLQLKGGARFFNISSDAVEHATFADLKGYLRPGDVLAVNTSATVAAALCARRADGLRLEIHLSTQLPAGLWSVELRAPNGGASRPFREDEAGVRLWIAGLLLPLPWQEFSALHGFPIRYDYVEQEWPLEYYQTVFAREPDSVEMSSAARPFSHKRVADLVAAGIQIAPLLLHAGVASLEEREPPYEEYYSVGEATALSINIARRHGGRIIAVGTTVVRALESVVGGDGRVHPGSGWTRLVIDGQQPLSALDALLTGLHEPRATHLAMLRALAGEEHLRHAYAEAVGAGYFKLLPLGRRLRLAGLAGRSRGFLTSSCICAVG
jgi:S-adenosylmethionine:tRNA ribosyltransferase-isomerase